MTPLTRATAKLLQAWQDDRRATPDTPVFATRPGSRMSTDAVKDLIDKHIAVAAISCRSLATKTVLAETG